MKRERRIYKVKCQYCNGTGERKLFRVYYYTDKQRIQAFKLWQSGLSLRAVAKKMGIKQNPQTIKGLINGYRKMLNNMTLLQ